METTKILSSVEL